jgi:hypothetical protein
MEVLDKKNIIHTVVDDPIPLYTMQREEAIQYLRDNFASWTYKMMEKYGRSSREEELNGFYTYDREICKVEKNKIQHLAKLIASAIMF